MLSYKPPDFVFRRNYGWYGSQGVGDGEFDTNRSAKGYDWYFFPGRVQLGARIGELCEFCGQHHVNFVLLFLLI